jgi:hypothetical protein
MEAKLLNLHHYTGEVSVGEFGCAMFGLRVSLGAAVVRTGLVPALGADDAGARATTSPAPFGTGRRVAPTTARPSDTLFPPQATPILGGMAWNGLQAYACGLQSSTGTAKRV